MRLSAFGSVCELPLDAPRLKIAFIKAAYACSEQRLVSHYCESPPVAEIRKLTSTPEGRVAVQVAERVLRYFHATCASAGAVLTHMEKVRFLGNVDRAVASVIHDKKAADDREAALLKAGMLWQGKLETLMPAKKKGRKALPKPDWWSRAKELGADVANVAQQAVGKTSGRVEPKVKKYDEDGKNETTQDLLVSNVVTERLNYAAFMGVEKLRRTYGLEGAKGLLLFCMGRPVHCIEFVNIAGVVGK